MKDGGQVCISYKFHGPVDELEEDGIGKVRPPIMFLIPGFTGDKTKNYVASAMNEAYNRGFDVILINHRGLGGIEITTPKLYSAGSQQDQIEVIDQISNKYPDRKLFALGISLGGNIVVNLMGIQKENCKLTAAVSFIAPIKFD